MGRTRTHRHAGEGKPRDTRHARRASRRPGPAGQADRGRRAGQLLPGPRSASHSRRPDSGRHTAVSSPRSGVPRSCRSCRNTARAACRISDPRLGQIFDARDRAEPPFIVTQWPYGTRLTGLLSDGPARPLPCGPRDRRGRWRAGRHARDRARAPRKDAMSCTERWTAARQPGRAHAGGCLQHHRRCEREGASASPA